MRTWWACITFSEFRVFRVFRVLQPALPSSWLLLEACIKQLTVLVFLGCYNKTLQTEWLINNGNIFLTAREAGSSISGCHPGWVLVRTFFWLQTADILLYPHGVEGDNSSLLSPFIRALSLFVRASPSFPNHLSKAPPSKSPSHWSLDFNLWILGGHHHAVHSTCHTLSTL